MASVILDPPVRWKQRMARRGVGGLPQNLRDAMCARKGEDFVNDTDAQGWDVVPQRRRGPLCERESVRRSARTRIGRQVRTLTIQGLVLTNGPGGA